MTIHKTEPGNKSFRPRQRRLTFLCLGIIFLLPSASGAQTGDLSQLEQGILLDEWNQIRHAVETRPIEDRSLLDRQALAYAMLALQDYPATQRAFLELPRPGHRDYAWLVSQLQRLNEHTDGNATSTLLLADAFARLGLRQEALSLLDATTGDNVSSASSVLALHLQGTLLALEEDFSRARATFQEVLKRDPNFVEASVSLANVHLREGNGSLARQYYDAALLSNSNHELASLGRVAAGFDRPTDFLAYINADGRKHVERMLVTGVFNSPDDAKALKNENFADPYGQKYTEILASSPDGNRFLDVLRAPVIDLGIPLHGAQFSGSVKMEKTYSVDQLDLHSQGVDAGLNLLALGVLKAKTINLYAPPGGAAAGYASSEKLQQAIAGADEVNIYLNEDDPIPKLYVLGMNLQVGALAESGVIGAKAGWRFGPGGPKINVWVFRAEPGEDHTEQKSKSIAIHYIYNSPLNGHTRTDYWQNIKALALRKNSPKPSFSHLVAYHVVQAEEAAKLADGVWEKVPDEGNWVLVGRKGEPQSTYIPVLLTNAEDSPEYIATQVYERNEREHPDQKAIIILEGDPNAEENQELIAELEKKGYKAEDIYSVHSGDLYFSDGRLCQKAEEVLSEEARSDPVLAQGIWGHFLRSRFNRPVLAIHRLPPSIEVPGPEGGDGEPDGPVVESEDQDEGEPLLIGVPNPPDLTRKRRNENDNEDEVIPDENRRRGVYNGRDDGPPPQANIAPGNDPRQGVYTVDDNNLQVIPAEEAGTGFIFGEESNTQQLVVSNETRLRVPFLLFPEVY